MSAATVVVPSTCERPWKFILVSRPGGPATPRFCSQTGVFDESAAEIVEHYAPAQRLLVVNAAQALVEVLDVSDPTTPTKLFDVQTTDIAAGDGSTVPAGIRVFGGRADAGSGTPARPVSENLEPEYVAIDQRESVPPRAR